MRIKRYNNYINENLLLKDDNLEAELSKMGVEGDELKKQVILAKKGQLGTYLIENGGEFTFGILSAIFIDAKEAKFKQETKKALWSALPRAIPLVLAPFFPIMAIVGILFGSTRLFNRITKPIFQNLESDSKYVDFLKSFVKVAVKLPEGEFEVKDRFTRAFVVEDRLIDALKPEVVDAFATYLSKKMEAEPDDKAVPDNYIENELKQYLNDNFDVSPEIPLKED
jgi:hypothetical protein